MNKRYVLSCPEAGIPYEIRIKSLKDTVGDWIRSDAFIELVRLFDGTIFEGGTLKEAISYYNSFAEIWDYRRIRARGGERWLLQEDEFLSDHKSIIMENMAFLGFTDVVEPDRQPDYILPLGGARMANLDRCIATSEVCAKYQKKAMPVVALTGMRPVNDIEMPYLNQYAPDAKTEYEAVCGGIVKAFNLSSSSYKEEIHNNDNINLTWAVRDYSNDQRMIHVLSAPSSDPERRANSMDTFGFFLERYNLEPNVHILLVTSCIYVPFQLMKFTNLAIEKDIYVDCIGVKSQPDAPSVLNTASYLQELKATINAIYVLSERYF